MSAPVVALLALVALAGCATSPPQECPPGGSLSGGVGWAYYREVNRGTTEGVIDFGGYVDGHPLHVCLERCVDLDRDDLLLLRCGGGCDLRADWPAWDNALVMAGISPCQEQASWK